MLLASCGGNALRWTPEYHTVRSGETLYSIAWQYNTDYRTLARWNGLGSGELIHPGQKIRLTGPDTGSSSRTSATAKSNTSSVPVPAPVPVSGWQWPTRGPVLLRFGQSPKTESGIQIGGRMGQPVVAAAGGEVVYAGSALIGYGQLVIIKHNATYLSAYAHNSDLLVGEGQQLKGGQQIAKMGKSPSQETVLHFEIRRNGQPVDPLRYLPSR